MNSVLALALLAAPAFAGRLEIVTDADGNRSLKKLGPGNGAFLEESAKLQAGMVKPASGKDSSSSEKPGRNLQDGLFFGKGIETDEPTPAPTHPDDCFMLQYLAMVEDVLAYAKESPGGTTYWFPVYDPYLLKPVGVYTESSTVTHFDECVTNGAFLMEYQPDDLSYDSMINVASTCTSTFSSVTGGTEKFRCATGFQEFTDYTDDSKVIKTVLYLCDTPCYIPSKLDDDA